MLIYIRESIILREAPREKNGCIWVNDPNLWTQPHTPGLLTHISRFGSFIVNLPKMTQIKPVIFFLGGGGTSLIHHNLKFFSFSLKICGRFKPCFDNFAILHTIYVYYVLKPNSREGALLVKNSLRQPQAPIHSRQHMKVLLLHPLSTTNINLT